MSMGQVTDQYEIVLCSLLIILIPSCFAGQSGLLPTVCLRGGYTGVWAGTTGELSLPVLCYRSGTDFQNQVASIKVLKMKRWTHHGQIK